MKDSDCVEFLQWALPKLQMRWPGFRKVRRQVCRRVDRRRRELDLPSVQAYRDHLEMHPDEWRTLDSFCRISISRFYRDRGVFDYLWEEILPDLAAMAQAKGEPHLRCWSAGCASGEEVYTLNIIWHLRLMGQFPDVEMRILATDSDPHMLDRARRACYSASSLKDFPDDWLPAAFCGADDSWCVRQELRGGIDFALQDIRHDMPDGPFHLILCRHLAFTYFEASLQQEILRRLLNRLPCGGILVTGKQEPLPSQPNELEKCRRHTGVYRKTEAD